MGFSTLLWKDVTILTPGAAVDRYNNTISDWTSSSSRVVKAWAAQTNSFDNEDHRAATVATLHATFNSSAALTANERVVIDGKTYEVVGEPNYAPTPRGVHHIEADLQACIG
jgi:hypothetical protein